MVRNAELLLWVNRSLISAIVPFAERATEANTPFCAAEEHELRTWIELTGSAMALAMA
jgi:hypothetical protein